jgi:glycosyltransferase involved in cell wall biosynthesis
VPIETANSSGKPEDRSASAGRILLFSYAFPPLRVQMTAPVVKAMAGMVKLGYSVDVVCADTFTPYLGTDESLVPYAAKHFTLVRKLRPKRTVKNRLRTIHPLIASTPDAMSLLHDAAYSFLMDSDLSPYDAVFTWSPFHSINVVMEKVKRSRTKLTWVAQFSDPWAMNPLEKNPLSKWWSRRKEPRAVAQMDMIIHSSALSRDLMAANQPSAVKGTTYVVPHAYDSELYPARSAKQDDRLVISHVGVLFRRRSPEPLFLALGKLLRRRPDLKERVVLQFVGEVPDRMLNSPAALDLPEGMIDYIPSVTYLDSLRYMRDADLLVLIEADVRLNRFIPSKLFDYMGAKRPIVGIIPKGGSQTVLDDLGADHVSPSDVDGLSRVLEDNLDRLSGRSEAIWSTSDYCLGHDSRNIAEVFRDILTKA